MKFLQISRIFQNIKLDIFTKKNNINANIFIIIVSMY